MKIGNRVRVIDPNLDGYQMTGEIVFNQPGFHLVMLDELYSPEHFLTSELEVIQ